MSRGWRLATALIVAAIVGAALALMGVYMDEAFAIAREVSREALDKVVDADQ